MNNRIFITKRQLALYLITLVLAVGLSACAGNPPPPATTSAGNSAGTTQMGNTGNANNESGINTAKLNQRGLLGIKKQDRAMFVDPNNPLHVRTLYFDFDSSTIRSKYADVIRAHAHYLAKHPSVTLRLEGHTDKRGTREYNLALGERRAESVKHALVLAGAGAGQITTLSYGEERPAVLGDTEADYQKNRRVVLIYVPN